MSGWPIRVLCLGALLGSGEIGFAQTASSAGSTAATDLRLREATVARQLAAERLQLLASPLVRAAKQWSPTVSDDAAARLARVAELCPTCRLLRPAAAVPLGELASGAAPLATANDPPVLWLPAEASSSLRERLRTACAECVQIDRPVLVAPPAPGGGVVVFQSVDPGGWTPGGEPDPCAVPAIVLLSAGALDSQIRAALARGGTNVTVTDYEAAAPRDCARQTLLYQLSVASQLLGGGTR